MNAEVGMVLCRARGKYKVELDVVAAELGVNLRYLEKVEAGREKAGPKILKYYSDKFRIELDELERLAAKEKTK